MFSKPVKVGPNSRILTW